MFLDSGHMYIVDLEKKPGSKEKEMKWKKRSLV